MMNSLVRSLAVSSLLASSVALFPLAPLHAQDLSAEIDSASEHVVRAFMDAYGKRDIAGMGAFVSDDISWMAAGIDSIVRPYFRGKVAFDSTLGAQFKQPRTGVWSVKSVTTVGPWLAAHVRSDQTSATGTSATMSLMVFEVRSGRIRRIWQYPPRSSGSNRLPGLP
jgi:hypothetical protein